MQKVVLSLEYRCFPIWLYDDSGGVIDNDLLPELRENKELCELLKTMQKRYDALFIDTPIEFAYIGFQSAEEKQEFANLIEKAVKQVTIALAGHYEIENRIHLD